MLCLLDGVASLNDAAEPGKCLTRSQACHMRFLGQLCIYNMGLLFATSQPSRQEVLLLSDALETKFSWGAPRVMDVRDLSYTPANDCS